MIVLVGESGSGKSSVQKYITDNYDGYHKLVTVTTRPPRSGEVDGVDYYFVTEEQFNKLVTQGYFLETATYNGWMYGCPADNIGEKSVAVLTPSGLRAALRRGIPLSSVYIKVDRSSRMIKMLQRGDDPDEVIRRSMSDVGQFDGVIYETDYYIHNTEYMYGVKEISDKVMSLVRGE